MNEEPRRGAFMSIDTEPPAVEIDLTSQAFKRDPFPTLARMRELGPVIRVRIPLFGKVWMATTYHAVNDLLRDHHRFVQSPATAGNRGMGAIVRWLPGSLKPLATNMLLRDPPDHRRLRSLVDQAFRRQSVEALRPRLEALADEALDRLEAEAARSPGGADLLAHFARPFPLAVICEILGLPPEDRPMFTRWASHFSTATSVLGIVRGLVTGVRPLLRYARDEIRRQSVQPRGGLIAALIEAEEVGDRLTEDELVAMVFLVLAAGHETTLHQIALNVVTLLEHPQQLAELTADWGLADSAAQELLRYVSFAQVSKPRYARADAEFHGQSIRRGQMVFACLADAPATERERDRDALKGDWKQSAFVMNGRARDASGTTISIDGDAITVRHGDEAEPPAPYTLDPAHKAIDLKLENEGRTMRGIYEVKGKTLKICLHPESRPSKFACEAGTGNVLMVFERP